MWPNIGITLEQKLTDLQPVRVLYEYDGPRIFICNDVFGDPLFAYQCDEASDSFRVLLVPFSAELEARLTNGEITVLDALNQPRIWMAEADYEWNVLNVRRIANIEEVPHANLPAAGTMLWADLEPLISLKAYGEDIREGDVPGSVLKETVERAEAGMRALIDFAKDRFTLPLPASTSLYDLPAQRFAFGSFEVSFRAPKVVVENEGDIELAKNLGLFYEQVSKLLHEGIGIATNTGTPAPEGSDDVAIDDAHRAAVLRAAMEFSPTGRSEIQSIEISGRILGTEKNIRRIVVGPTTHKNAKKALNDIAKPEAIYRPTQFRGWIKVMAHRNPLWFNMDIREKDQEIKFELKDNDPSLWATAIKYFDAQTEVVVSGTKKGQTSKYILVAINEAPPLAPTTP